MKKISILFVIMILLSGCGHMQKVTVSQELGTSSELPETGFDESADCFENSAAHEYPISTICVPDKESAIRITKVIMDNFQKDGLYLEYVPLWVRYDTDDEIWVVVYGETLLPGGGVSIAIRKSNAEIVAIWSGE